MINSRNEDFYLAYLLRLRRNGRRLQLELKTSMDTYYFSTLEEMILFLEDTIYRPDGGPWIEEQQDGSR